MGGMLDIDPRQIRGEHGPDRLGDERAPRDVAPDTQQQLQAQLAATRRLHGRLRTGRQSR